jgi:hypothetical protein
MTPAQHALGSQLRRIRDCVRRDDQLPNHDDRQAIFELDRRGARPPASLNPPPINSLGAAHALHHEQPTATLANIRSQPLTTASSSSSQPPNSNYRRISSTSSRNTRPAESATSHHRGSRTEPALPATCPREGRTPRTRANRSAIVDFPVPGNPATTTTVLASTTRACPTPHRTTRTKAWARAAHAARHESAFSVGGRHRPNRRRQSAASSRSLTWRRAAPRAALWGRAAAATRCTIIAHSRGRPSAKATGLYPLLETPWRCPKGQPVRSPCRTHMGRASGLVDNPLGPGRSSVLEDDRVACLIARAGWSG